MHDRSSTPDPPEPGVAALALRAFRPLLTRWYRWQCAAPGYLQVTKHRIVMKSLATGEAIRAVFLTDLHFGNSTPTWFIDQAIKRAAELQPDLILIGGDLWTYVLHSMEETQRVLSQLSAPLGIYAVPGNHDIYVGRECATELIESIGARMLLNEGLTLSTPAGELYLCGVDDAWRGEPDIDAAMAACPHGVPSLMLSHQARALVQSCARRPDVCLSGHSHGGQICWPSGRPIWFYDRDVLDHGRGWTRIGRTWSYVSRGIGSAPMPLRLNCRPEISVFDFEGGPAG